ncbi:hypothetical protein FSP39_020742 [Pinctada imbricata]|uniref:Uncharacterized protein n=1 Tax=Pinctada imbricata TaxID=66713 RepID=A0AA89C1S0_PINIB|nr:hypothetical protein FSP39_020742 [Pinctada imbricata]
MRKRKAFRETVKGAKLSDDVTKENGDLIRKLLAHEGVDEAWYFNCNIYAKLKGGDGRRVKFDIDSDIEKKIKKRRSGSRKSDPSRGYETVTDSDSD